MSPDELDVSVVVVNKDDERIADTLAHLTNGAGTQAREIVVVDGSSGRLEHIARQFPQVRWIDYVGPSGKARTIAEQRNVGVRAARGGIVVFLDANCVPGPGWLDALVHPVVADGEAIVAGSITSIGGATIHDLVSDGAPTRRHVEECANMNVAYRRDVFERVGYFDESLGFAEDVDFSWRARDTGLQILYEPAAAIAHDWGRPSEDLPRAFRYGVGRTRLLRKHRSRINRLVGVDRYVLVYALFLVFLPVVVVLPEYLLLLAYPLAKNRRLRPVGTVAYQLAYAAGFLSELFHVPVLRGQRGTRHPT